MLDPETLAALEQVPRRAQSLWLGSRRPSAAQLADQGPLDLMIWLDPKAKQIRTGMVAPRSEGPEAMLVALVQAMMDPAGDLKPGIPSRVAVEDTASRAQLTADLAPLGVEVVAWPGSTVLDEAFQNMEDTLSRGPGASYLDKPDNTPELVGRLFDAAARFFDAAPWEGRADVEPVRIVGLNPSPLYVSLLGDAGQELGLAVYLTVEAAKAVLASEDPAVSTRHPVLFLSYTNPDEVGPGLLIEASDHGWPIVDAECLPLLARSDRPTDFVAHGSDVELAVDVMHALVKGLTGKKKVKNGMVRLEDGRTVEVTWPARP